VQALHHVSIEEKEGEIVALIGSNGAGKTTLLNIISGILKPSSGKLFFQEKEISSLSPEKIVEMGIGQVPEGRLLFGPLTVRENLELGAYRRRRKGETRQVLNDFEYVFGLFPTLKGRIEQKAGTLSGGEQQMLAIGRGLMGKPVLMLLDEPSLGLAPLVVQEILSVIKKLKQEGTTSLLVEQNAKAALGISDRAYVLETGKIGLQGKASDLFENEEVKKAYLGRGSWRKQSP
jgi:branched-chain amino acid transport system ATP-binding protein